MKWLSIVGVGEDGFDRLSEPAKHLVEQAEVLVSSQRIFDLLGHHNKEQLTWGGNFSATVKKIISLKPRKVCILATGDPMFFGIGSTLTRYVNADETEVVPLTSVFSLICAKLMWSQREAVAVSLHGREINSLLRFLHPGAKLVLLSYDEKTPEQVAELLCQTGYAKSKLHILEHLGGKKETISQTTADEFALTNISGFNTIALECIAERPTLPISRTPGLADHYFSSDGVMTKKHVRALTVSSLAPKPGEILWDLGAGSGTIAIEWLRCVERTKAYAIEQLPERIEYIRQNANSLGTPELNIIESVANPQNLANLPEPDAIFIGGGSSDYELIRYCWDRLKPNGRLVINSVSVDAELNLLKAVKEFGGGLSRIAIEHLQALGKQQAWKPERTISHYYVQKDSHK